jgi:hypothetical protein
MTEIILGLHRPACWEAIESMAAWTRVVASIQIVQFRADPRPAARLHERCLAASRGMLAFSAGGEGPGGM